MIATPTATAAEVTTSLVSASRPLRKVSRRPSRTIYLTPSTLAATRPSLTTTSRSA